jgi:excisionase family DNA binding protein
MSFRRINSRRIKVHRTYTVEEIARLLDIHKNTVRNWLKQGLKAIDEHRPILIHGQHLRAFLDARRERVKQTCGPGQFYCVKCRAPKEPAGQMADYLALTATSGNLRGLCPTCGGWIYRRVSRPKLAAVAAHLEVSFPQLFPHIGESFSPSLNCDSN